MTLFNSFALLRQRARVAPVGCGESRGLGH
jgi:hypothetical protein